MAEAPDFDLIVIGGGINGAGIARDAASRGLRTCLLEQGDACQGTTRWSSRLIHGGLRYLEHGELGLVYESLHEREALLRIAPHLVAPLRLLIPIYRGGRRGRFLIRCGMWLYDLLSFRKTLPRHDMLGREATLAEMPSLNPEGLLGAATYFDGQVTFAERLVVENLLSAHDHGADIKTYCRVDYLLMKDHKIAGVRYTNLALEQQHDLFAPVIVNAAGPWVDRVLQGLPRRLRRFMGGTKGTHIIVPRIGDAPGDKPACYLEAQSDGRPFFIIPWNGMTLIGTTDIRYDGNPGQVRADESEIDYLLNETNRVLPGARLSHDDIHYSYTGVRPLPRRDKKSAGAITRRHIIRHHRLVAPGLYSVIGGKLTTFRSLAEEVTDRIARRLKFGKNECVTARDPLPGGGGDLEQQRLEMHGRELVSIASVDHLLSVYGNRATLVLDLVQFDTRLSAEICAYSHAIAAEIVFAFENEFATTLADALLRRTMIGLSPDLGRAALPYALRVARQHLGWSAARADAEERRYLRELERMNRR